MKKKIIIEGESIEVKEEVIKNNKVNLVNNKFIEWIIYMIGYSLVLVLVSLLFDSFYINLKYYGLYAFLASIIIYALNKTIKPFLNYLTLPITILSMGLSYPLVNLIILRITSLLLGKENFYISGFIAPFFVVMMISFLNILMEGLIIKQIVKGKNNG